MKLYGIPNCDTVKKVRKKFDVDGVDYEFVDLKTTPLNITQIAEWLRQCPDTLVNKRSTTYREIKAAWLVAVDDIDVQIKLIQDNPTIIKRPLIEYENGEVTVGLPKS